MMIHSTAFLCANMLTWRLWPLWPLAYHPPHAIHPWVQCMTLLLLAAEHPTPEALVTLALVACAGQLHGKMWE